MLSLWRGLIADEQGQDTIEYALLTASIALAGAAAFNLLIAAIGATYGGWNSNVNSLWKPDPPIGS